MLDTNVASTSTVQFDASSISGNINVPLSSDKIQPMDVDEPQPSTSTASAPNMIYVRSDTYARIWDMLIDIFVLYS